MRPIDIVPFALVALAAIAVFFPSRPLSGPLRYLPLAALAVAGVHLGIAYRTSFLPVYGLALLTAFSARGRSYERLGLRRAVGSAGLVALAAGGLLAWAFPLFSMPTPSGEYAIGTRYLVLTDSTRSEELTPDSTDKRRLLVRLWYPADSVTGTPEPFSTLARSRELSRTLSLPRFALDHLERIPTHSHLDAPLSRRHARWPVVIFSHGYGAGYESQNSVQMEALASHGFVVASIAHSHEAGSVVFPDGHVARLVSPMATPDSATIARMATLTGQLTTLKDTTQLRSLIAEMQRAAPLDSSIRRWTDDTRFVADQLALRNAVDAAEPLWPGRLVTDTLGVFGMSFGGATAANFCTLDVRCVAGMNLDGLTFGEATDIPMPRPFFFVTSEPNRYMHELFAQRATAPSISMTVARSMHLDYTDLGFLSPLFQRIGVLGGIPAAEIHDIMNASVVGFFSQHLRGEPFDATTLRRFPEVTVEQRTPATGR